MGRWIEARGYAVAPIEPNLDAGELRAALSVVLDAAALGPEDAAVLYFSGHGCVVDGDHYLAVRGFSTERAAASGLKTQELVELVTRRRPRAGKVWLILDCCTAGGAFNEALSRGLTASGAEVFVLAASGAWSSTYDGSFSAAFVAALEAGGQQRVRLPSLDRLAALVNAGRREARAVAAPLCWSRLRSPRWAAGIGAAGERRGCPTWASLKRCRAMIRASMDDRGHRLSTPTGSEDARPRFIGARVLAHPQPARVGDYATLFDEGPSDVGRTVALGRLGPSFRHPSGPLTGALDSARITRTPLEIVRTRDGLRLRFDAASPVVEVNRVLAARERLVTDAELAMGIIVLSGRDLALWIGWVDEPDPAPAIAGLIGESAAMRKLRQQIHRVADLDVPVLLRGATGVGKELVAAAIHASALARAAERCSRCRTSRRPAHHGRLLSSSATGAAPFTGARRRSGSILRAGRRRHGSSSTEIGDDCSFDVQALLLRAVQEGVIQPLGGTTRQVDVRLIAATDSDLESAVARREFREPLLRRFSYEIHVPSPVAARDVTTWACSSITSCASASRR